LVLGVAEHAQLRALLTALLRHAYLDHCRCWQEMSVHKAVAWFGRCRAVPQTLAGPSPDLLQHVPHQVPPGKLLPRIRRHQPPLTRTVTRPEFPFHATISQVRPGGTAKTAHARQAKESSHAAGNDTSGGAAMVVCEGLLSAAHVLVSHACAGIGYHGQGRLTLRFAPVRSSVNRLLLSWRTQISGISGPKVSPASQVRQHCKVRTVTATMWRATVSSRTGRAP
jgi:hypothetical protein